MADERSTVRSIAWQQVFPSLRLLAALRMSLNTKALVLAAIAIAGTVAGWRLLGEVFADEENQHMSAQIEFYSVWPWQHPVNMTSPAALTSLDEWYISSPLTRAWHDIAAPFRSMVGLYEAPTLSEFVYLLCCALWGLLVWSFFGGAISRLAAVSFARQENVSLGELWRFAGARWSAYFVAPLFPLLGAGLVALVTAGLGLIMRVDPGILVASILWPLVLLGGFVMAFLLIGLFFGFPLMWAAISAEGTDSFGALSHAYSYVYQRPLRYLGYAVLVALAGVLGMLLVGLFADWILVLSNWAISWGSGVAQLQRINGPESMGSLADTGAAIIGFWTNCVLTLAYGFIFSYFWTSTTAIYFLLRRLVDATEIDEVYMPLEREQHGLPPLKTGADGLPTVDDEAVSAGQANSGAEAHA